MTRNPRRHHRVAAGPLPSGGRRAILGRPLEGSDPNNSATADLDDFFRHTAHPPLTMDCTCPFAIGPRAPEGQQRTVPPTKGFRRIITRAAGSSQRPAARLPALPPDTLSG